MNVNEWDLALNAIQKHGKFILIGAVIGMMCAIFMVTFQKPVWRAEIIIGPTQRTSMPSMSNFLPKIATDTPVLQYFVKRIDAANSSDFTVFETLINSSRLADKLRSKDLDYIPSKHDLATWMKKHIKIRGVGVTPFRKITLLTTDQDHAMQFIGTIYQTVDLMIRRDARTKTSRRITYLKEQLKITKHPDHRDAIIALLKEQEQTAMMVSIDNAFAAKIIDGPSLSVKPIAPDWRLLFPILIFSGAMLGLMFGGFRTAFIKR